VRLSPDLHYAVAYITVMNDEAREQSLRALKRAVPFLRRALARRAGLRRTPELRFVSDEAAARGARLEQIFEELSDKPPEPPDRT
jgi:ribosome-binding factor A